MKKIYSIYFVLCFYLFLQANVIAQISGTVTINSALPTSGTNYQTFSALAAQLNSGGISGPLYVNVISNTGPYIEQPVFYQTAGVSATNTITINGNNNVLTFNSNSSATPWTLLLNGADYMNFHSLNVVGQGTIYAMACNLCLGADNNVFSNCSFSVTPNGTSSYLIPVAISGSSVNPFAGLSGSNNTFSNCNMINGYYGAVITGSASAPFSTNNSFLNCAVSDWYMFGIHVTNQKNMTINYCSMERPNRIQTGTAAHGINFAGGMQGGIKCVGNCIQNLFGSSTNNTVTVFGMYVYQYGSTGLPANTFSSNVINNLGASGTVYGMYYGSSISGICNSNTVVLNNTTATTSATSYGIYMYNSPSDSSHIFNNYISITQGGMGPKYGIYFGSLGNALINYNQFYISTPSSMSYIGYAPNVATAPTFSAWQGGGYDLQGINYTSNPNFTIVCATSPTPASNFSGSSSGCEGSVITFSDHSTNSPNAWNWTVSPNTGVSIVPPTSQNPQITFANAGTYSVTLVASNSIGTGNAFTQTVIVNPLPTILLSSSPATICSGASATLMASGALTYTWSPGNMIGSMVAVIHPVSSTTFTSTGTDSLGCVGSNTVLLVVSPCVQITELNNSIAFKIYPNPNKGEFLVESSASNMHLRIFNTLGQKVHEQDLMNGKTTINAHLAPGIYSARLIKEGNTSNAIKLIVE